MNVSADNFVPKVMKINFIIRLGIDLPEGNIQKNIEQKTRGTFQVKKLVYI
jgi:hypothetical protein